MKYLKNFFQLNESQSKKIKKVLTFSVVLDWYNDNKNKIANIIGCNPEDLATENELLSQSRDLISKVINPQIRGNSGNDFIEIAGFSRFTPLDKYLLHDILHNIYDVSKKGFNKSLNGIEFTESEVFEEIEVLCIEESFMKFFNIRYPKTDFINQNINQLASFLMMTILKNDPTRIKNILDNEIEPYLEIYGVKYEITEDSPYKELFLTLKGDFRDMPEIENSNDFKDYMIKLINIAEGIDVSNGDRSQYPGSGYYGSKRFEDATIKEMESLIYSFYHNDNFIIISSNDTLSINDLKEKGIRLSSNPNYIKNIDYNNLTEVKLPFKKQFLESDYINLSEWFDYLSELSQIDFYNFDGITYLVIYKEEDKFILYSHKEFNSCLIDEWFENDEIPTYEEDHKFIDFDYYQKLSFEKVSNSLFNNIDAVSIMRRNFRDNDIIVNNTKLGNLYTNSWGYVWKQEEIPLQKDKNYFDFKSKREDKISISKNILTDNGKKLISVLNSIRGYAIKNYKELKNKYKNLNISESKLTREDIETYINLDFNLILEINNIYYLNYYVYILLYKNKIELINGDYTKTNIQFINKLDNIISLLKKMNNKENISLLKSYVTKYKIPNYGNDPIKFYQELLNKLLNNYNSLIKLKDLNNELLDGKYISEEESKKIIYLHKNIKTNRNEYNEYLIELIEKYFNQYGIIIDIPDSPSILGGSIGLSIEKIILEIKNPPI